MIRKKKEHLLVVLADDLTGCGDAGYCLIKHGISSEIITDISCRTGIRSPHTRALIINTESRHLAPRKAYNKVKKALAYIAKMKPSFVYKKIDSTLRGNIGPELDACIDFFGLDSIGLVPAYPLLDRYTIRLHHYVGKLPVHRTYFGRDPQSAVTTSHIPGLISEQSRYAHKIWVPDVRVTADLTEVARSFSGSVIAGSAGLLEELLKVRFCSAGKKESSGPSAARLKKGDVLILCGSKNPVSIEQVNYVLGRLGKEVRSTEQTYTRCVRGSLYRNPGRNIILVYPKVGANYKPNLVLEELLSLVQSINQMYNLTCLFCLGGETAYRACDAMEIDRLQVEFPIARGVVGARTSSGLMIVLKPGGFGTPDLIGKLL
jgi:uncharacterized protein YgbK (DUF1537 family)